MNTSNRKRPFGKVTLTFTSIIIVLIIIIIALGSIMSDRIDALQTDNISPGSS